MYNDYLYYSPSEPVHPGLQLSRHSLGYGASLKGGTSSSGQVMIPKV